MADIQEEHNEMKRQNTDLLNQNQSLKDQLAALDPNQKIEEEKFEWKLKLFSDENIKLRNKFINLEAE